MKLLLFISCLSLVPSSAHAQFVAGVNFKAISASGSGNYCMDAADNRKNDGTKVFMFTCHGRENQRWTVTTGAEGTSAIIGTGGYCLDVRGGVKESAAGTPVQLWKCNFNSNQRFTVGRDGTVKEQASGKCLQATADKEGAAIVIQACTGAPTEKWRFEQ